MSILIFSSLSSRTQAAEPSVFNQHEAPPHHVLHDLLKTHAGHLPLSVAAPASFVPLSRTEIAAVHAHLVSVLAAGESPNTAAASNPPAFRCLVSGRLQRHTFVTRGPSLIACCGENAARTLAFEKSALTREENHGLLPLLVALQEQFESLDYEEKLRAFTQKVGNLYEFVRKTDTRMHALLAHHRATGRPLLPAKADVKFLPSVTADRLCTRRGIKTWTWSASPCSSLAFPRAQAASVARAAVEVIASFPFLAHATENSDSLAASADTNPTHSPSGAGRWRLGKVEQALTRKKETTTHDRKEGENLKDRVEEATNPRATDSVAGPAERERKPRASLHRKQGETARRSSNRTKRNYAYEEEQAGTLSYGEEAGDRSVRPSRDEEGDRDPNGDFDAKKKVTQTSTAEAETTPPVQTGVHIEGAPAFDERGRKNTESSANEDEAKKPSASGKRQEQKEERPLASVEDSVSRLARMRESRPTQREELRDTYLKLLQRAAEAHRRLQVVDVEEMCIQTAVHVTKERARQEHIRRENQADKRR